MKKKQRELTWNVWRVKYNIAAIVSIKLSIYLATKYSIGILHGNDSSSHHHFQRWSVQVVLPLTKKKPYKAFTA